MSTSGGWFVAEPSSTLRYHRSGTVRKACRSIRKSGGFRMVRFNLAGWSALLAPGVGTGTLVGHFVGGHWVRGAVIGAATAYLVGLTVDSVRWRASTITFTCPEVPVELLEHLVEGLVAEGVEAVLEVDDLPQVGSEPVRLIRSRMRHRRVIEQDLALL